MPSISARPARKAACRLGAIALALSLAGPALLAAQPASAQAVRGHGDPEAESFVQTQSQHALDILNDHAMGTAAKKQAFYSFVNGIADVPRITDFVLGRYRRGLTPAQYSAFSETFRTYADSVYESRLSDYHGQQLKVTGSQVRQPGDVIVSSVVTGGTDGKPAPVLWRVLKGPNGWKVVDVNAVGVWLAVVEQQDFTSTLANNNGNIEVLIGQLRAQAAKAAAGERAAHG
jgi:phospholipid transport system substrate-binding protein